MMSIGFRLIPRTVENPSHPNVLSLCCWSTPEPGPLNPTIILPLELLAEFITLTSWKSVPAGGEVRGIIMLFCWDRAPSRRAKNYL